jgi:biotin carboxyl carrier protein
MSAMPNRVLLIDDTAYETQVPQKYDRRKKFEPPDPRHVRGFIPGVIVKINVRHGQKVRMGETLLILEAMKMQNNIIAPMDSSVKVVLVSEGQKTRKDQVLLELE